VWVAWIVISPNRRKPSSLRRGSDQRRKTSDMRAIAADRMLATLEVVAAHAVFELDMPDQGFDGAGALT